MSWNTRSIARSFRFCAIQADSPSELYQVPVIELGKQAERQAVCRVFEKVNTGGATLTVFELLTATCAADEFDLRDHWDSVVRTACKAPECRVLKEVSNTDFLQAVTPSSVDRHARPCPTGACARPAAL